MCLAQGHSIVTLVRLEPTAPWYRVNHSTNKPLRSYNVAHQDMQRYGSKILPAASPPKTPTLGVGSKGQNSTFQNMVISPRVSNTYNQVAEDKRFEGVFL